MGKLKIGGASLNQVPMDWDNNLGNIFSAIEKAKEDNVKILCLPELAITGYGCEDMFLSEWLPKKAFEKLPEIVNKTDGISVAVGLPIIFEQSVFNTVCYIANKKVLGFYAKQKLANDGVHYEPRWFTPWVSERITEIDFMNLKVPFGHITIRDYDLTIGFEICEDAWRADRPGCHIINEDVDLFLNPSASHFAFGKAAFRENLVIESSKLLDCTYLYANLLGNESGRMIYDGDIIIAQAGELKARNTRLSYQNINILSTEVDFEDPGKTDLQILPDIKESIHEFGQVASLALFDYLRKSKSKGFVLSLSGGADSSCIAVLVAEMVRRGVSELGGEDFIKRIALPLKPGGNKDLVHQLLITAYQGTENSSPETYESAKGLAESIGAVFYEWKIDTQVSTYRETIEKALGRKLTWEADDITLQNIQARARSPIIWMLANISGSLLLSTSNRSEGDVGYATMDGDTSGSISPIAAVSKRFILEWLGYAENKLGYTGLKSVNSLQPTAELRPRNMEQTDEKDLMPYEHLLTIEKLAIRHKKSPTEVYKAMEESFDDKNLLKTYIKRFFRMWSINQWKRERIAPSFHLDDFNIDPRTWCRFPILSSGFSEELKSLDSI
ncbi:MAG: NAD(+) synthase [Bacteroidota bacterium]